MKVAVVGLGKLGLPLLAALGKSGFLAHGYDVNRELINSLKREEFDFDEPQLTEFLESARGNLLFQEHLEEACTDAEIIFIIVPTPSEANGRFSNELIIHALTEISTFVRRSNVFQVINIVSTVMPGSCSGIFIPLVENLSGKKCGIDFGFTFNPEFIALGSVIKNMQYPDMHLIGASDEKSGRIVSEAISNIVLSNPVSKVMNLTEAELVKISVNNFVTMKISFANMMMEICDSFEGTNVDVVTEAIGLDSRIGSRYLRAGMSFGGPCFPRDTRALDAVLKDSGIKESIPAAVHKVNSAHSEYVKNAVLNLLRGSKDNSITLIGIAYKEDTKVTEESASLNLAFRLISDGTRVFGWDPLITESQPNFPKNLQVKSELKEALSSSGVIAVLRTLKPEDKEAFQKLDSDKVVFDPWRQFSTNDVGRAKLVQLGIS